jgi:lysine 2,3-aminomutase
METGTDPFSCRQGRHYATIERWRDVAPDEWADWRWQIRNSLTSLDALRAVLNLTPAEEAAIEAARAAFRFAVTPYLAALMDPDDPSCPIRMQFIPSRAELGEGGVADPLAEEQYRVAPGLIHRYPDRALLLVNNMCAAYCRFCTRKRLTSLSNVVLPSGELEKSLEYLRAHPQVRDVLVSGGDPLTMSDANLERVVAALRDIPSIEIIRIGTRMPMFLPMRVTDGLVQMLAHYHPVWINTHFNHPKELTPEARAACERIVNAGIPLGNQSVLLRGVNSNLRIMRELVHELVRVRVRPYYIYQCDLEQGTEHFHTPVDLGLNLMEGLRGHTSGFAVPTYVIDAPGGGGKIPVAPNYVAELNEQEARLRNYEHREYVYPQPHDRDCLCPYDKKWEGARCASV